METKLILTGKKESIYQDKQQTFILSSQVERWAASCIINGSGEATSSSIACYIFSSEVGSCIYWKSIQGKAKRQDTLLSSQRRDQPLWIWPLDSKSFGFCFSLFEASEEERPKIDLNLLKKANSEVLASTAADENQIHHSKSENDQRGERRNQRTWSGLGFRGMAPMMISIHETHTSPAFQIYYQRELSNRDILKRKLRIEIRDTSRGRRIGIREPVGLLL